MESISMVYKAHLINYVFLISGLLILQNVSAGEETSTMKPLKLKKIASHHFPTDYTRYQSTAHFLNGTTLVVQTAEQEVTPLYSAHDDTHPYDLAITPIIGAVTLTFSRNGTNTQAKRTDENVTFALYNQTVKGIQEHNKPEHNNLACLQTMFPAQAQKVSGNAAACATYSKEHGLLATFDPRGRMRVYAVKAKRETPTRP